MWRESWTRPEPPPRWRAGASRPKQWESRLTAKHIFTHVEWHMTGYTLEVAGDGPADLIWANAGELGERAVPSAFARYYDEAKRRLGEME